MLNKKYYKFKVTLELLRDYHISRSCDGLELCSIEEEYG